jgi:hypothetical protein
MWAGGDVCSDDPEVMKKVRDALLAATQYANTAASLSVQGFGAVQPLTRSNSVIAEH